MPKGQRQFSFVSINAPRSGPKYGETMTIEAQMLILRLWVRVNSDLGLKTESDLRMFVKEKYVFDKHEASLTLVSFVVNIARNGQGNKSRRTAWETVEKNPFSILTAMKESKLPTDAQAAAEASATIMNQKSTGKRPK